MATSALALLSPLLPLLAADVGGQAGIFAAAVWAGKKKKELCARTVPVIKFTHHAAVDQAGIIMWLGRLRCRRQALLVAAHVKASSTLLFWPERRTLEQTARATPHKRATSYARHHLFACLPR